MLSALTADLHLVTSDLQGGQSIVTFLLSYILTGQNEWHQCRYFAPISITFYMNSLATQIFTINDQRKNIS